MKLLTHATTQDLNDKPLLVQNTINREWLLGKWNAGVIMAIEVLEAEVHPKSGHLLR